MHAAVWVAAGALGNHPPPSVQYQGSFCLFRGTARMRYPLTTPPSSSLSPHRNTRAQISNMQLLLIARPTCG